MEAYLWDDQLKKMEQTGSVESRRYQFMKLKVTKKWLKSKIEKEKGEVGAGSPPPSQREKLVAMFKNEISDRAKKIDRTNEHDWHSLTYGWALAKGLNPDDAYRFATYIRYETELG